MIKLLRKLLGKEEKKIEWDVPVEKLVEWVPAKKSPLTEDMLLGNPLGYELHELGMGCSFVQEESSRACWLHNRNTHSLVPLLDTVGNVLFLDVRDIEKQAAELIMQECPNYWMRANFRFWVYPFVGGKAPVEWTICPDGRYWADEDGYGMTDDEKIVLHGHITTMGKAVEPFVI